MKKKISAFTGVVLLCTASFFIGKTATNKIDTREIVHWSTNGKELSLLTEDGLEWYAYGEGLPDFAYIEKWEDCGDHLNLISFDGDLYRIDKEMEE